MIKIIFISLFIHKLHCSEGNATPFTPPKVDQIHSRFNNPARQIRRVEHPLIEPLPEPEVVPRPPSCEYTGPNPRRKQYREDEPSPEPETEEVELFRNLPEDVMRPSSPKCSNPSPRRRQYRPIEQAENAMGSKGESLSEPELERFEFCRNLAKAYLRLHIGKKMQKSFMFGSLPVKELGRGSFGTVFAAEDPKICYKCTTQPKDFASEQAVANHLHNLPEWPCNLLRVHKPHLFEDPLNINGVTFIGCVPMERLGHNLDHVRVYTILQANQVWSDIGAALCALSDSGLAHCDVKSANVLCYNEGGYLRLKLGDVSSITVISQCTWHAVRGTVKSMSPSMLMNFHHVRRERRGECIDSVIHDLPADLLPTDGEFIYKEAIWQFAILLLEMLSQSFRDVNLSRDGWWHFCAVRNEIRAEGEPYLATPSTNIFWGERLQIETEVKVLLRDMLQTYPERRMNFSTLKTRLQRMYIK